MTSFNQLGQWQHSRSGQLVAAFKTTLAERLFANAPRFEEYSEIDLKRLRDDLNKKYEQIQDKIDHFESGGDFRSFREEVSLQHDLEGVDMALCCINKTLALKPQSTQIHEIVLET